LPRLLWKSLGSGRCERRRTPQEILVSANQRAQAMSKDKLTPGGRSKKKTAVSLVHSSAAEYLSFVAAGGDSLASVEMRYEDENIWLTQKMMAELYGVSVPAVNQHLKRIFSDNELEESSVVKQYLITAADGKATRRSTTACKRSSPLASKSRTSAPSSSASGPTRSSRTTPSKGGRWIPSASSMAATATATASSLSDLSRPAAKIGVSARISPRLRHLCSHKLLKLMKILTRTPIPSPRRSKSDRLLGICFFIPSASLPPLGRGRRGFNRRKSSVPTFRRDFPRADIDKLCQLSP